jgi:hypothetical protein
MSQLLVQSVPVTKTAADRSRNAGNRQYGTQDSSSTFAKETIPYASLALNCILQRRMYVQYLVEFGPKSQEANLAVIYQPAKNRTYKQLLSIPLVSSRRQYWKQIETLESEANAVYHLGKTLLPIYWSSIMLSCFSLVSQERNPIAKNHLEPEGGHSKIKLDAKQWTKIYQRSSARTKKQGTMAELNRLRWTNRESNPGPLPDYSVELC